MERGFFVKVLHSNLESDAVQTLCFAMWQLHGMESLLRPLYKAVDREYILDEITNGADRDLFKKFCERMNKINGQHII